MKGKRSNANVTTLLVKSSLLMYQYTISISLKNPNDLQSNL